MNHMIHCIIDSIKQDHLQNLYNIIYLRILGFYFSVIKIMIFQQMTLMLSAITSERIRRKLAYYHFSSKLKTLYFPNVYESSFDFSVSLPLKNLFDLVSTIV